MTGCTRFKYTDDLHREYSQQRHAILQRLSEFAAVSANEYLFELAYCLLTPQSSAVHAATAVEAIREARCWRDTEAIAGILRRNDSYIRFHNTKARHVAQAWTRSHEIVDTLCSGMSSMELRAWLVRSVKGLGWKEASHFLRNIGHRNLAILDRHILRNLKYHGAIRSVPPSLTASRYHRIEQRFTDFAGAVGISMDELDLLFWSRETGTLLK